jgi:hypothetical protein
VRKPKPFCGPEAPAAAIALLQQVSLIGDYFSGNEDANFGFVAHFVAEAPGGPRGDPVRSPQLADDVGNLILMCYPHRKLIDIDEVEHYPSNACST